MKLDKARFFIVVLFGALSLLQAESTWEKEKLSLEIQMQERVEMAVSRILPRDQFLIVIQVEPMPQTGFENVKPSSNANQDEFFLPGVPVKQSFTKDENTLENLVETLKPEKPGFLRFIQRLSATVVIDREVPDETVEKIRNLTRQMLGFSAERGDTLDIQRTAFHKTDVKDRLTGIALVQEQLKSNWLIVSLLLTVFCILFFFLFVFGPLRGFLNRFVQILPTLKPIAPMENRAANRSNAIDPNVISALLAQAMGVAAPNLGGPGAGPGNSQFSGSLMVENPNKSSSPFSFIREHHLGNLAILLGKETPEKAATVLGYLPPEWISRVLSKIEPYMQSQITENLATTRQLLPEQVEDIEQDLKRRLDYLVGGPDRLFAVYDSLDSEGQHKMFDNLRQTRPELAEELRKRTFMFEDLNDLDENSLKSLLREIDLQTLISALKGLDEALKNKLISALSPGKAEIVKEEMEFSEGGGTSKASMEARRQIIQIFKRLEAEGQVSNPKTDQEPVPTGSSRFGLGGKTFEELGEGASGDVPELQAEVVGDEEDSVIGEKIKNFMSRGNAGSARYGGDQDDTDADENRE